MTSLEWWLLITLSLVWGSAFFFHGIVAKEVPAFTIVVTRSFIAAFFLLALVRILRLPLPDSAKVWGSFVILGLLNNIIPFSLIAWGQSHIGAGLASILNATTPLFTVIVAHMLTEDEKLNTLKALGVVIGLFGVSAMVGVDALQMLDANVFAQLAILGAALSYAFAGIFARRFNATRLPPISIAACQVLCAGVTLTPVMLIVDRPFISALPGVSVLLSLVGLGIFSTALAYVLYFRILVTAGATNMLLVTFLVPVSAIALGIVFLDEQLLLRHVLGMLAIFTGLAMIDGRLVRRFR